jgi:dUTPase
MKDFSKEDVFGNDLNDLVLRSQPKGTVIRTPEFKVSLVREGAIFEKNLETDAGYDVKVFGREIKDGYIKYFLGIKTEIPVGYYATIHHRSSNSDKDLLLANALGIIDAGFRGEWQARVKIVLQSNVHDDNGQLYIDFPQYKHADLPLQTWNEGEKALQVMFHKILEHDLKFVTEDQLSDSERGDKGHGSSGKGLDSNTIQLQKDVAEAIKDGRITKEGGDIVLNYRKP